MFGTYKAVFTYIRMDFTLMWRSLISQIFIGHFLRTIQTDRSVSTDTASPKLLKFRS